MELALTYLVYFAAAFGLSFVVGFSALTQPGRDLLAFSENVSSKLMCKLLECPGCLGFWTGFCLGVVEFVPDIFGKSRLVFAVALGFATCGVNMVLAAACGLLVERVESTVRKS